MLNVIEQIHQQTKLCEQDLAERELVQQKNLDRLTDLCELLPKHIIKQCPKIENIIENINKPEYQLTSKVGLKEQHYWHLWVEDDLQHILNQDPYLH